MKPQMEHLRKLIDTSLAGLIKRTKKQRKEKAKAQVNLIKNEELWNPWRLKS